MKTPRIQVSEGEHALFVRLPNGTVAVVPSRADVERLAAAWPGAEIEWPAERPRRAA